jgi:hypothetical protein
MYACLISSLQLETLFGTQCHQVKNLASRTGAENWSPYSKDKPLEFPFSITVKGKA